MTITIYCFRVYCCPHLHLGLFMVSLLKNHQLENFRLAIVDLSSICFDFGLFSKNFLAPSVTFKFSRTKVITNALLNFPIVFNHRISKCYLELQEFNSFEEHLVQFNFVVQEVTLIPLAPLVTVTRVSSSVSLISDAKIFP